MNKALEVLETLSVSKVENTRDAKDVERAIRSSVMSKQYGHEDFLTQLISKACISILPENSSFNVDNVRVCKILGSGLLQSTVIQVGRSLSCSNET